MTPSSSRHERAGSETESSPRRKRSAMSWPPSFLTMALSWPAVRPADANSVLMILSPGLICPFSFSSNPRRNHGLCGHSEEWPSFKPLFAMTNRKSYQRTMPTIIHLNDIFVNMSPEKVVLPNKSYYHCNRSGDQIKCTDKYVGVWDLEQQIADLFKLIEFTPTFVGRMVAKIEKIYSGRKEVINKDKKGLNTQKMILEKKRDTAEEKLFGGLISDDDFTRIKVKIKEQVEGIQDELYAQDKKLNMRIDELQDILLFVRNAYEAYNKAPDEMKRLFLCLYWERFEVTDKKVVTVIPSPIIRALMQAEGLIFTEKYKECQKPRIVTDTAAEFTPVITGKSKPLVAPKTQKSRRNAEIPVMVSNEPSAVILDTVWGA